MKVQMIYNECACPSSEFLQDAPPADMEIMAVADTPVQQALADQLDTVRKNFGTDCGTYSVRLSPSLPSLLTLSSVGGVYTD